MGPPPDELEHIETGTEEEPSGRAGRAELVRQ
jgi:hypothetical protein